MSILVTGFGPFDSHQINSSWESVKLLPDFYKTYQIHKHKIPVCYKDVDELIPKLWQTIKPDLVIHVGLHNQSDEIRLETIAYRDGYIRPDVIGQCHPTGCCVQPSSTNPDQLQTKLDINHIKQLLSTDNDLNIIQSYDPGHYLCSYIYYLSLMYNSEKTIFIHVPPSDKPYSIKQLSNCLLEIIQYCLIDHQ